MSQRSPIRISQITSKKVISESVQTHRVTMDMVNYAKEVFNQATVTELANNISESAADCNRFCGTIIEMATKLDKKYGKPYRNIHRIIEYHIIPKLNQNTTKEIIQYVSTNETFDNDTLKSILEDTSTINRVIANHNALSKRFNMDKIARETIKSKDIEGGVREMCSLIDTYDISKQARFNVALESINYYMKNAGCHESVLSTIVDYFLTNESVIDDSTYETMQNLIKDSRLLSESEKAELSYFTEAKGNAFEDKIDKLASKCKNDECTRFITTARNVKNEKEAASYIKNAIDMADMYKEDSKHIIASIFALPLMGKVSKAFVSYQYKFCTEKKDKELEVADAEFIDVVNDVLDDEDDMMIEASLLEQLSSDVPEDKRKILEYSEVLESEDYADSADIKDLLKEFKAEQKKDMGRFKYYMSKIYRKSPESIIDGTPEILNIVRVVFILAPAAIPYIGPVISLVGVLVDRILHMKINDKETEKLIRKLESELDKIDKDIEKHPDKKEELTKYKKCIEQCIKKVDAYRDAYISSDELENRRGSSSSSDDGDDDFDFDLDGDFDFGLESVINTMDAISIIAEAENTDLSARLLKWSQCFDKDVISELADVIKLAPRSINPFKVFESTKIYNNRNGAVLENAALNTFIDSKTYSILEHFESNPCKDTVDSIITEAYIVHELSNMLDELDSYNLKFVTEASITNKIKLTLQAAKGKVKELDTKQKSMWQNLDIAASGFMRNLERSLTSDRREGVIKGSLIPSFSKCIKSGMLVAGLSIVNPVLGIITAMGMIGASKKLNDRERQLIYDEIDTELKVIEKEIEMANNDGDTKKYRMLLQYQKRLDREKQRIKYGLRVHGRDIPDSRPRKDY